MLCCCGILQHFGKKLFDNYVDQIEPTQFDDVVRVCISHVKTNEKCTLKEVFSTLEQYLFANLLRIIPFLYGTNYELNSKQQNK